MIHTLTAHTTEVDQIDVAVKEILQQLDLENNLCKNTVGIIACHYEFLFSGVTKAVCDQLPFDVVGTIASSQAVPAETSNLVLTLMVLTSDEESFETVLTPSLQGDPRSAITEGYSAAAGQKSEKPALVLAFAGFMVENSGDNYVRVLSDLSQDAPCFGTLSVDDTPDFEYCYMLHNGQHYRDRMAVILVYGEVDPRFYIATLSEDKIIDRAALVTASEGHILKELNGRPVLEYFRDLGLSGVVEQDYGMSSLPFMMDYGDGTPPVSKVFIGLNEEQHAICAGDMPQGASLYLGVFDKEDVLLTTSEAVRKALVENPNASGILIYSCVSRFMSMAGDLYAELQRVQKEIGTKAPFMMAYSGGEMCPTQVTDKGAVNRFHNNAFIVCVL